MIVLIPSYKRTEVLENVIKSVLRCDINGINERVLILIVNNYPPNQEIIDKIINKCSINDNFQFRVIHRKITLPATESWFMALASVAIYGEVIMLLGDDDIILPWGLKNRYVQIMHNDADMLISDFYQRLYFFDNGNRCWFDSKNEIIYKGEKESVKWGIFPEKHPEASFISNHCYRYTDKFKSGLELAMKWCKTQTWVPIEFATGNLPFYLAYALNSIGGNVIFINEESVIRGSIAKEAFYQDYSDGGNTSFYCLLIYNTFSNKDLHKDLEIYKELRSRYKKAFIAGLISIFLNKKIKNSVFLKTLKMSNFKLLDFFDKIIYNNIIEALRQFPFFRGYKLKQINENIDTLEKTADFVNGLSKHIYSSKKSKLKK